MAIPEGALLGGSKHSVLCQLLGLPAGFVPEDAPDVAGILLRHGSKGHALLVPWQVTDGGGPFKVVLRNVADVSICA